VVEHLAEREIRLRMPVGDRVLRPGGTVSGPTQFALVDSAPV
jgi:acyl-coenzyme A thioesterase PaaI-like protein